VSKKIIILLVSILLIIVFYKIFSFKHDEDANVILEVSGIKQSALTETPKPTSSPTPSPTPIPTPTPFSYYAPSTLMSFEELVGSNGDENKITYQDIPTPPSPDTYKLVVNLYYQFVTVLKKDDDGNFTIPVRYMLCSTGTDEDGITPIGEFEIGNLKWRFTTFDGSGLWAQYLTLFKEGGYYFHSVLYTRKDAYYYRAYSYNNLGAKDSHGCIRLTVPDARWIWYYIAPGSKGVVIEGSEDPAQSKIREQLVLPKIPPDEERPQILKKDSTEKIPITEPWPGYTGPITPVVKESSMADETTFPQNPK